MTTAAESCFREFPRCTGSANASLCGEASSTPARRHSASIATQKVCNQCAHLNISCHRSSDCDLGCFRDPDHVSNARQPTAAVTGRIGKRHFLHGFGLHIRLPATLIQPHVPTDLQKKCASSPAIPNFCLRFTARSTYPPTRSKTSPRQHLCNHTAKRRAAPCCPE